MSDRPTLGPTRARTRHLQILHLPVSESEQSHTVAVGCGMVQTFETELGYVRIVVLADGKPTRITTLRFLELVAEIIAHVARHRTVDHELLHLVVAKAQHTELVAWVIIVAVTIESNLAHICRIVLAFFHL